jgi:hypothetical protein
MPWREVVGAPRTAFYCHFMSQLTSECLLRWLGKKLRQKNWKQRLLKHYMLTAWPVSLSGLWGSVCSPVHLSIYMAVYMCVFLSLCLSILSLYIICSQLCHSLCLFSVGLSVHLSICQPARMSVFLSVCLSHACLSLYSVIIHYMLTALLVSVCSLLVCLFTCLSAHLHFCQYVCLPVILSS